MFFVTGQPGVGKTSVVLKAVEELKQQGFAVGGMISREIREGGTRVGFEILDIATARKGWLAHVNQRNGPQVGKYRVNLDDLKNIGVNAIINALANAQVILIDEIGSMELHSQDFKNALHRAVESNRILLGTIHFKARDPLIQQIRIASDAEIIEVTLQNRDTLHRTLAGKIVERLRNLS